MQRLLARNKKSNTDGGVFVIPEKRTASPAAAPAPAETAAEEPRETIAAAVVQPVRPQPAASVPLPAPSHTQDKATVRADLDSLRNIANSAARSAIAHYTTKSTREKIFFRMLLLTISVLVAAVLLLSSLWGYGDHFATGWCALVASGALGADILLHTRSMRSQRSRALAPAKRTPEGDAGETDNSSR
jgi:hypothetical protein